MDWRIIARALLTACPTVVMLVFVLVDVSPTVASATTFLPLFAASSWTTWLAWLKQFDKRLKFSSIVV